MVIDNYTIYKIAKDLIVLQSMENYIPAKANFFMQKNIKTIMEAAKEIEKTKMEIAKHYGELDESQEQYFVPEEKIPEVNKEFEELCNIEQDLDIKTFSIDALGDTEFTAAQMQAIMFMIED